MQSRCWARCCKVIVRYVGVVLCALSQVLAEVCEVCECDVRVGSRVCDMCYVCARRCGLGRKEFHQIGPKLRMPKLLNSTEIPL